MKRIVSITMALLMCFTAVAIGINSTVANAADPPASNFLLSHPAPAGVQNTANPYGKPKNRVFSLSTMNELFYYQSWDGNYEEYNFDLYDSSRSSTLDLKYSSAYNNFSDGTYWLKDPNRANSSNPANAKVSFSSSSPNLLGKYRMNYVQSVGFDPLASGKDDHIAFIGYTNYNDGGWINNVRVIVQNLKTNKQYELDLGAAPWIRSLNLPYYLNAAYFEITAGDFDDDGKDSLIVYYPANGNDVKICEITIGGSGNNLTLSSRLVTTIAALRPYSTDLLTGHDGSWQFKPTVSFAVGDFDANGVEDLAISTGFGNPGNTTSGLSESNSRFEKYVTGVSVMQLSGSTWSIKDTNWMYDQAGLKESDSTSTTYYYKAMHMGDIAAGDVDGNGYDDIIVAGYTSYDDICRAVIWKDTSKGMDIKALGDMDKNNYAYSIISYHGSSFTKTVLDKIQIGKAEKEHFYHDDDSMWPQLMVEAAYTNGRSNPAEVFIDGSVYRGKSGALISQYDTKVFTQSFSSFMNGSTSCSMIFTTQVAAGNFDGNTAGREQFVYVLAFKESGQRDYAAFMGIVGGCEFDDVVETVNGRPTVTDYGEIVNYGCSDIRGHSGENVDKTDKINASKCLYEKGSNWLDSGSKFFNALVCAVDYDNDGLRGRFNNHSFITTDPSPVAVLQTSPYFKSLDDAGAYGDEGNNAGTTYTIGYSYEKTTSKGNSVSFGVGFAGELQAGHFKASLEVGYSLDWSETFEKSVTKEYEHAFTASQDSVLVTIVPVHVYSYDIYDPNTNTFKENSYSVTVPAEPVYRMMSIDEYNEAVDGYNAYIDSLPVTQGKPKANKLKKITYGENYVNAVLPDAEGNPYVYQQWTRMNQIDDLSNGARFGTGTAGGTTESSYNYSTGTSHSTEMAHGFNFSLTLQGGGEVGNDFEMWGGGYVNLDYSHSKGQTVSTSNSEGFKVGIVDPSPCPLVPGSELNKYYFKWYLAQWYVKLTEGDDTKTPVVGFGVSDVTSPVGPPKNLAAEYILNENNNASSSIKLTWEKPDSILYGPTATGYIVYDDGIAINSNPIAANSDNITYTITGVEYGAKHHFTVKAITAGTGYLSTPSNEAILGWVSNAVGIESIVKDTTYVSSDGLTDRYIIKFTDNTKSDFFVKNGKDGASGANGVSVSSGYIDDSGNLIITLSDGSVLSLGAVHGSDGNGIADVSIKNQTDNVDTYTITFTDGTTKDFTVTNGKDGVGISDVVIDGGNLVVTLTDGTTLNLGAVKGDNGITPKLKIEADNCWYVSYDNGNTWTSIGGVATVVDGITPQLKIGDDNSWYVSYDNGLTWDNLGVAATAQGPQGRGITDISQTGTENGERIYTVTYSDDTTSTFRVANGKDGTGVMGASIDASGNLVIALTDGSSITLDNVRGADGLTPQMKVGDDGNWYVSYDNGTNWTSTGATAAGRGILNIEYISSEGNEDTYHINYTDGNYYEFTVHGGRNGDDGVDGVSISAVRLEGDDLIISFSNGDTTNIGSVRGATGQDAIAPKLEIRDDNFWYISYDDGQSWNCLAVRATGDTGATGRGIFSIDRTDSDGLIDTYTITYTDGTKSEFKVTNGGKDAFLIAQENGFTGTYQQWLDSVGVTCAVNGHAYDTYTIIASCAQGGLTLRVCSVCGYAQAETSEKISHSYTETVIPSTHFVNGYTKHVCSYCAETYIDSLTAPTPHEYTADVVAPTCTHMGYTTYKCTLCDNEYISDIVPATEHKFKAKVVDSTCNAGGFTIKYCEDCGFTTIADETEAKGHSFEVTSKVEPTCLTKGYSVYTCKNCGVSYNADETECKAHTYSDKKVAPDCENAGYTIHTCKDCGFALIDSETPATGHTPGEWICEDISTGKYVQRCENCYKLLDTKTVAIGGNGTGEGENGSGTNPVNPNIDENGVLNIEYGHTEQLKLYSNGVSSDMIVYTTSNSKVATVDTEGNVTAVGPGDAIITASIPGTEVSTQIPVTVKLKWWQKIHYLLNSAMIFRAIFMLLGITPKI